MTKIVDFKNIPMDQNSVQYIFVYYLRQKHQYTAELFKLFSYNQLIC